MMLVKTPQTARVWPEHVVERVDDPARGSAPNECNAQDDADLGNDHAGPLGVLDTLHATSHAQIEAADEPTAHVAG